MSVLVDNPVLNSPFDELIRNRAYEEGQPKFERGEFDDLTLPAAARLSLA
jgi:hypothetical protein